MKGPEHAREPQSLEEALALLASADPRQRAVAARALGRQGPDVAAAAPALLGRLGDEDPMVRAQAATALGRIGALHAVGPLRRLLEDPVAPVRFWAAEALARLAPSPGQAAPDRASHGDERP